MINFFTYGTFRKGECRHSLLTQFGADFVKTISTAPEYKLINLGSFPGMLENGNGSVVGELYEIPDEALYVFDMIESHPTFFCRKDVKLEDGTYAISYVFPHSSENFNEIKTGDWLSK